MPTHPDPFDFADYDYTVRVTGDWNDLVAEDADAERDYLNTESAANKDRTEEEASADAEEATELASGKSSAVSANVAGADSSHAPFAQHAADEASASSNKVSDEAEAREVQIDDQAEATADAEETAANAEEEATTESAESEGQAAVDRAKARLDEVKKRANADMQKALRNERTTTLPTIASNPRTFQPLPGEASITGFTADATDSWYAGATLGWLGSHTPESIANSIALIGLGAISGNNLMISNTGTHSRGFGATTSYEGNADLVDYPTNANHLHGSPGDGAQLAGDNLRDKLKRSYKSAQTPPRPNYGDGHPGASNALPSINLPSTAPSVDNQGAILANRREFMAGSGVGMTVGAYFATDGRKKDADPAVPVTKEMGAPPPPRQLNPAEPDPTNPESDEDWAQAIGYGEEGGLIGPAEPQIGASTNEIAADDAGDLEAQVAVDPSQPIPAIVFEQVAADPDSGLRKAPIDPTFNTVERWVYGIPTEIWLLNVDTEAGKKVYVFVKFVEHREKMIDRVVVRRDGTRKEWREWRRWDSTVYRVVAILDPWLSDAVIAEKISGEAATKGMTGVESALTFTMHLVPTGAALDHYMKGETGEMWLSLAGDAAMFLTGPLAKFATAKSAITTARALKVAGAGLEITIAGVRGKQAVKFAMNGEYAAAAGAGGETLLRLFAAGAIAKAEINAGKNGAEKIAADAAGDASLDASQLRKSGRGKPAGSPEASDHPPHDNLGISDRDYAPGGRLEAKPRLRPGSISQNPANKKVEIGVPTKDGGWARRWIRMTDEDHTRYRRAISDHYNSLLDDPRAIGLSLEAQRQFRFSEMQKFRTEWIQTFLKQRKY